MVGNDTIHTVTRKEHDCIGYMDVPKDVYWGIHTQRALGNFTVSRIADSTHPQLMRAYATVKRACAEANDELGLIDHDKARLIVAACRDVENGELADQFPVDVLQGGAGTSTNMNMNEVIANRALELGGHSKGDYGFIHPNDDVNHSQSTNDTYPAACKLALIDAIGPLAEETKKLTRAFHDLADKHTNDVTIGRTQLQDAVPMTYGQEFHAFASFLKSDLLALEHVVPQLTTLNLGATAIGTGINADERYLRRIIPNLSKVTGLELVQASDLIDATQNLDGLVAVSGAVKTCAVNLSKMSNDLRLMSSGPRCGFSEINLPPRQNGSSIMPGKVNPVIPEVVSQVAFNIIGNDVTVTMAAEAGQLELNAFEPIIFYNLIQSVETLTYAVHTFVDNCVTGITANRERCRDMVEHSVGIITALCPHVGYEKAAEVAKRAIETGAPVRRLILEEGLLDEAALDKILDPYSMTEPGISGKELLEG